MRRLCISSSCDATACLRLARPTQEGIAMLRLALPAAEAAAIVLLGLMSGFFFAFAVDVVPAMAQLDGPTYATTQQWINRVVRSAPFGLAYFGAVLLPFVVA